MKKLLYKGIEFDDFQLYREMENSSGCEYGYSTEENLSKEGWEEADVYICPHCIKKYNLYSEAETDVKTVEEYISGELDDGIHSMVCGVKGCNNGNSFDCCINIAGCQLVDVEPDFTDGNFIDDAEKMRDFKTLSKEEFLASYSYLTEAEYDNTMEVYKQTEKEYQFDVRLCDGYYSDGTYTVVAQTEEEAQDKALQEICEKLYKALPELGIEVSVELHEE